MVARIVIAGVSSGVGKTTVAVGLARALGNRGLRVAMFKCGPDYLDPTYHASATGARCHNLDGWMMGRQAVVATFERASQGADVALIEGVMGLFDGASPTGEAGSTAEIAKWLSAPVLLVLDASGMARSVAALVQGFASFDPELTVAGAICNRVGSRSHLELLGTALRTPRVIGGLPKQPAIAFGERHLGLRNADHDPEVGPRIDAWAKTVEEFCDVDGILALARAAARDIAIREEQTSHERGRAAALTLGQISRGGGIAAPANDQVSRGGGIAAPANDQASRHGASTAGPAIDAATSRLGTSPHRCRIGIALDAAFQFYYEDNLRRLEALGAELVPFSPIADAALPDVDGLYIGGGYPELHAEALERNVVMREAVLAFSRADRPIYAECGGLMYLAHGIRTRDGVTHAMVGVVPGVALMAERLQALGYVEVETQVQSVLGPPGLRFRGHQFRYSTLELSSAVDEVYTLRRRRGGEVSREGYRIGQTLGSYVHAHWASNPLAAAGFVDACARARAR